MFAHKTRNIYEFEFPMHLAAITGDLERVRQLVEESVSVNSRDDRGRTPLHWAAEGGRYAVVDFLSGLPECDLDFKACDGSTPVLCAANKGKKHVVDLLLQRGAQVNCATDHKWTLLHYASQYEWTNVVRLILDSGEADVNAVTRFEATTPLMCTTDEEVAALLIRAGADVNQRSAQKTTTLHLAAYSGRTGVVQVLLKKEGLDLNPQDEDGYTPLHDACRWGRQEVVKQLLVAGADTTIRDTHKRTALHRAAFNGRTQVVQVLLEKKGLDLNTQDEVGYTPLHWACRWGYQEIVKQLLVAGADINIRNTDGGTAIGQLIRGQRIEEIRLLVQGGAFLQDCEYKQMYENCFLRENILNDVGLCTQFIVNKFHRQSLPALGNISYFARKLPNINKFKLKAQQIDEVENLVTCEILRNTFCNVVKAHPMALSALCVLSLITCQSGTKRSASPDFGDSNSPFKKLHA